jgi:uncharacterized protein YecA (UPF0149 family)
MKRNELCSCGSGKKYKKCCLPKPTVARCETCEKLFRDIYVIEGNCIGCRAKARLAKTAAETEQLAAGQPRQYFRPMGKASAMMLAALTIGCLPPRKP